MPARPSTGLALCLSLGFFWTGAPSLRAQETASDTLPVLAAHRLEDGVAVERPPPGPMMTKPESSASSNRENASSVLSPRNHSWKN